jgi:hypothetical protein
MLDKINGLRYTQEYLCLAKESFEHPLHAYLMHEGKIAEDITAHHLFVGYNPLVFALPAKIPVAENHIEIAFTHALCLPNESLVKKEAIARLRLRKIHEFAASGTPITLFEGTHGSHRFLSRFHQQVIALQNRLYNRKKGNVFLSNDLYRQVQIAYAIPRKICVITVGKENLFNLFPTDLHGKLGDRYIISLRQGGQACAQVEASRRLVISDMPAASYKRIYSLGKNHMQPLKNRENFEFEAGSSPRFNLPLPSGFLSCKELELADSFTHGIHKIFLFRIISETDPDEKPATLSHVHNAYATWRHKHRVSSNFLLR